jgi:hypothetical protein
MLQVLAIKLRQMEGGTLAAISQELTEATGDMLERRVAAALGPGLPTPQRLPLTEQDSQPRGRVGRALSNWRTQLDGAEAPLDARGSTAWHHFSIARGLELHVHQDHPLAARSARAGEIAEAIRNAVARFLSD